MISLSVYFHLNVRNFSVSVLSLLTGLNWAGLRWIKVMSHISLHQPEFSHIIKKGISVVGSFMLTASTKNKQTNKKNVSPIFNVDCVYSELDIKS